MSVPFPHATVVQDWFRALLLGDLPTLRRLSLSDVDLNSLVRAAPRPAVARAVREIEAMPMTMQRVGSGRYAVFAWLSGAEHALVLQDTLEGPRVDAGGCRFGPGGTARAS